MFISTNVRKLDNKLDEIREVSIRNNAKVICITETWLTTQVPDHIIAMPGYNVFRKDRTRAAGGGVCMHIHESIPCKQLVDCIEEPVEALWMLLRLHKNYQEFEMLHACIIAVVVYHTISNREPENLKLIDHIQRNFNPNSTGLKQAHLTSPNHLKKLITFNTREYQIWQNTTFYNTPTP